MIDNKIADKISKVSRSLPQNNSETVTNEHDKEIPKERHISPKKDIKLLTIWDWYKRIIMEYQTIINLLDNTSNQLS